MPGFFTHKAFVLNSPDHHPPLSWTAVKGNREILTSESAATPRWNLGALVKLCRDSEENRICAVRLPQSLRSSRRTAAEIRLSVRRVQSLSTQGIYALREHPNPTAIV